MIQTILAMPPEVAQRMPQELKDQALELARSGVMSEDLAEAILQKLK